MRATALALSILLGVTAGRAAAAPTPRVFVTHHTATIDTVPVRYTADYEEFLVADGSGTPALSLFATSYVRDDVTDAASRPVIFIFNGGPSAAATGLHMQFGPRQAVIDDGGRPTFGDNPNSLLDVADLVMFDPAETGFSRLLQNGKRDYFYSVDGDAYSLAQMIEEWLKRHGRERSPCYLLGESYGSIRAVVTDDVLAKRGDRIDGNIILGDSLFLQETSRRTHNIVSSAVSLPLLAMTAAYHGKADRHGKTEAEFLDEVYEFATTDYLLALSRGYDLSAQEKQRIAKRLAAYTGISVDYYLQNGLVIAKQDFNRLLLPGQQLDVDDTRLARSMAASSQAAHVRSNIYQAYLHDELGVALPGMTYQDIAPDSFESWDWGNGCNAYLMSAGLCTSEYGKPSVFEDYDWPEVLKRQFVNANFRTMIIAGYYDGLSSIGTHRYLKSQLGFPGDRFELREYAAGHATAADPIVRPQISRDIKMFLDRATRDR